MNRTWQAPALALGMAAAFSATLAQGAVDDFAPQVLVNFTGASGEARGVRPEAPPLLGPDGRLYGLTYDSGEQGVGDYFVITQGVFYSMAPDAAAPDYQASLIGAAVGSPLTNAIWVDDILYAGSTRAQDVDGTSTNPQAGGLGIGVFGAYNADASLAVRRIALPAGTDTDPSTLRPRGQITADAEGTVYFSAGGTLWRIVEGDTLERLVTLAAPQYQKTVGGKTYFTHGISISALTWSDTDQALYGVTYQGTSGYVAGDPDLVEDGQPTGTLFRIAAADLGAEDTSSMTLLTTFSHTEVGSSMGTDQGFTGLIEDGEWLYGVSSRGIWRIHKQQPESFAMIHHFSPDAGTSGGTSLGPWVRAADGHLYGTTKTDHRQSTPAGVASGPGTLFRVRVGEATDRSDDQVEVLHQFDSATDGGAPLGLSAGDVVVSADGEQVQRLFGVTQTGGAEGQGTVFSVAVPLPSPAISEFVVTPSQVTVGDGQAPTLSWQSVGLFGDVCEISAADSADYADLGATARDASGSVTLDAPGQYGEVVFTLQCTGAQGSAPVQAQATLSVARGGDDNGGGRRSSGGGGAAGALTLLMLALAGVRRRR